ncbi:UPF0058 family protein [Natronosalvus vescus]|uniref:UPF0058 family protein n=1 Tax=Natronosalvus vescus TaxID=2953881 RepID=UPI0020907596|nr:UPF0058 family protein [Natronosalvus vescus]
MRKQELIHLHALTLEIRAYIVAHETIPADPFEQYDRYGVSPTSIHYSKTRHKESLQLLLEGLHRALDRASSSAIPDADAGSIR